MCSDTQAKHLDLLPESMMEALLVKHYTVRPINLKMFCTSDFCAACTRVCVCARGEGGRLLGDDVSTHKSQRGRGS